MSIIRVNKNKENPYVMINKTALGDDNLSYKAKGIFAYLMSKPDNWKSQITDLMKHAKDGRDSVYSGLRELREHGYMIKTPVKNEKGQFIEYEEILYETPQEAAKEIYKEQKEARKKAAIKKAQELEKIEPLTENTEMEKTTNGNSVCGESENGNGVSIIIKEKINNDLNNNDLDIERDTRAGARASEPVDNVENVDNEYQEGSAIKSLAENFNREFERKVKGLFELKTGLVLNDKETAILLKMYIDNADYCVDKMNEFELRAGRTWSYFVSLYNSKNRQ